MKKILALVVAMLLVMSMVSAFAVGSIQLNDTNAGAASHEYKVYQIFTGTLTADGKLENVKYGKNFGNTGSSVPKTELDAIGSSEADAIAYAKSIESQVTGTPYATINANEKLNNVPDGYYLIVDDTSKELTDGDAYSRYMIQVVKDVEIAVKKSGTTSDKEIDEDTLGNEANNVDGKIDNVTIGDTVTFKLTATVASDADTYDKYFFVMNDTLDAGFTFSEETANIVVKAGETTLTKDTDYKVYTGDDADGKTFQIAMLNAKALAGQTITVTYQAVLNENCNIHEIPNKNTFYVTYSNNPKHEYDHDEDKNKPGKPDSTKNVPTGETPEQETETYTTGLKIKKVDQDGMSLAGATFTIEGTSLEKVVYYTEAFEEDAAGTYYKLKNGSYTTEAPVARAMEPKDPEKGVGYVLWQEGDEEEKVTVNGVDYRVVRAEENGVYTLQEGNVDLYDSTETKYTKTETKQVKDKPANNVSETLTVGADGILKFDGLGAGEYTITEIAAPAGYTKIANPIKVTIEFVAEPAEGEKHWKDAANAPKDEAGYYTVTVENVAGNVLPTTGGMGTTILYIGGSILVLAAVILLVTKRRMRVED